MALTTITELRRTGAGVEPTLVTFRWTSSTHSSLQGTLEAPLTVTTSRTVPAGGEIPVEQVLGVAWDPFEVSGEWSDQYGGPGFAGNTEIAFAQMVGRTPLVRLQIDQQSWVGLITKLAMPYKTSDRIGYKFTLSPHANERVGSFRQSKNKPPPQPLNVRADIAEAALQELRDVADLVEALPTKGPQITESIQQLDEMADAVARARQATDDANTFGGGNIQRLLSLAGSFGRVRNAAQSVFEDIASKRADLTLAFEDAVSTLKFKEWSSGTISAAARSIGTSSLAEIDFRARASRRPRAIHVARAGESLERIALRYTGNADNWKAIYDASGLTSIVLEGGEELIIPERSS